MKPHIVVIGASAGGVEALSDLLEQIPQNLDIAIFIVLHMNPYQKSMLGHILAARTTIPITTVATKTRYQKNHIYVCPPDHHMLIDDTYVDISVGPKINNFRPSIEPLFSSAAQYCTHRVVAILLTGLLYDGILGLTTVKRYNGVTIVQDPKEAKFADLPLNALKSGYVDFSLNLNDICLHLTKLVAQHRPEVTTNSKELKQEHLVECAAFGMQTTPDKLNEVGRVTDLTCPECSGSLWEIKIDHESRYVCRIGHQYNIYNIEEMHSRVLENLLWAAVKSLEESGSIAMRIAKQFKSNNLASGLDKYTQKAKAAYDNANKLRDLIVHLVKQEI